MAVMVLPGWGPSTLAVAGGELSVVVLDSAGALEAGIRRPTALSRAARRSANGTRASAGVEPMSAEEDGGGGGVRLVGEAILQQGIRASQNS